MTRLNEGYLRFLDYKNAEIIEQNIVRAYTMPIQIKRSFQVAKIDNTPRNNWKPLFEVNFYENSTKTIRLFALDFYEVIVDSAFGLINYHLIEIESE